MGVQRMGPPTPLILALQQRLALAELVETGTYRGDTAEWAAKHFARVTTIELSCEFHAAAVARFKSASNVRPLQGDSATVLARVVAELRRPALFWLDAHWSGLDTAGRSVECPLLAEVATINAASLPHVIVVDDARLFCAPPPPPHRADHWPDLAATVSVLTHGGRRHVALFEDVFVAVPSEEKAFLTTWLQAPAAQCTSRKGVGRWWKKFRA